MRACPSTLAIIFLFLFNYKFLHKYSKLDSLTRIMDTENPNLMLNHLCIVMDGRGSHDSLKSIA